MLSNEILNLHEKLDKRILERDTEKDDRSLAQMAEQEGWAVLLGLMESMISELLESPEFSDETPLDVRGAVGEARKFGVDVLRKVIANVESTHSAIHIGKQEKATEESKQDRII